MYMNKMTTNHWEKNMITLCECCYYCCSVVCCRFWIVLVKDTMLEFNLRKKLLPIYKKCSSCLFILNVSFRHLLIVLSFFLSLKSQKIIQWFYYYIYSCFWSARTFSSRKWIIFYLYWKFWIVIFISENVVRFARFIVCKSQLYTIKYTI